MVPGDSKKHLQRRFGQWRDASVGTVLQIMLDFYAEERAAGCLIEEDGDMLLYQWGTYDWGNGEHFELDLTRQFILPDEDEPYQLSITLRFTPTEDRRALGSGNQWCPAPNGLPSFRDFIIQSAPYKLLGRCACPEISVDYSQC